MKIVKYYRGHNKNVSPLDNHGIIWLTDEIDYAENYIEDDYENNVISVVYVDFDKLEHIEFEDEDKDDFDPIDPDMDLIKKYKEMGYNCYDFSTTGDSMILALLSTDPVVKTETIQSDGLNEVKTSDINLSSFKIKPKLHPKFWINDKLNSRIRLRLLDIADDFINDLSVDWVKPKDVLLTGSIANYNWSKYSDVDIHIVMDFKKVYAKNTDFVNDYFKSKKENWLAVHEDLTIFGFPIEISVEDSNDDNPSSGRYSLYKNKWIVEPDDFQNSTINQKFVKKKSADFMTKIDEIEQQLKTETDLHKCEKLGNKVYAIFDKMKRMRSSGLESTQKEMSSGNIIYKIMRRAGYIDKIWDIYNLSYDKVNSMSDKKELTESKDRPKKVSAGIIPYRKTKSGNIEVFVGLPGKPKNKEFDPPKWMERWQILKGHIKDDENVKDCAIREFCEECGIPSNYFNKKDLEKLGTQIIDGDRELICYSIDLTNDDKFDSFDFHSNLIDSEKYIKLNGGEPYPEIVKYKWKKISDLTDATPYEKFFYNKCGNIVESKHNGKTIILTSKQKEQLFETN